MYFTCPYCKTELRIANPKTQIIRGKCPHCGHSLEFDTLRDGIQDEEYISAQRKSIKAKSSGAKHFKGNKKVFAVIAILLVVIGLFAVLIKGTSNKQTINNFTVSQTNTSSTSLANADKLQQWNKFRSYYPYNFQTIAAKHYSDDSHVVIISEPADCIPINKLTDFFKEYDVNVTADCYQTKMGYDGWLKDYVFAVNNIERGKFDIFIEALSKKIFRTEYKAYYLDLSTLPNKVYYSSQDLNYSISAAELKAWIIDGEEKFYDKDESSLYAISKLLKSGNEGVYFSETPGFVLWLMGNNYEADKFMVSARKFALESDLILGAIDCKDNNHIAIIGRERSIPIYELPPLQAEIMLMLASTRKVELCQSYERGHAIAGKLPGGKDFAPILLSPELWHTEYGSLLNITDQMLKSWSENGDVDYEAFNYPKPNHWAFKKGVYTDLNTQNSLTYNWNTSGAGYYLNPTTDCPYRIYAVNRTGSLPVSYIPQGVTDVRPNDKVFLAEEKAYDFFSHLNNPELVRVVQYASFYQIMQYYKPRIYGTYSILSTYEPSETTLNANKRKIVENLKTADISKQRIMNYYDRYYRDKYGYQYSRLPQSSRNEICNTSAAPDYTKLLNAQRFYNSLSQSSSLKNTDALDGDELQLFNQIYSVVPLSKAKEEYISENQGLHSSWIKCPTIVLSWSLKDSTSWVGGHNLNSQITPIFFDDAIRSGDYKVTENINGQKEIRINPNDIGNVSPSLLRQVNRTNITGNQHFRSRPIVVRRRNDVMRATQHRSARGFNMVDHVYK